MASTIKRRTPWDDKFNRPTEEQLAEVYQSPLRELFDDLRTRINAFEGASEELVWLNSPWRWCFRYALEGDPTAGWCYLVPDPEKPKVGMPLTGDMLRAMPLHRFKKHIKESLAVSQQVGDVAWATFDVAARTQLDDVMDMVKRKHGLVTKG